MRWVVTILAAAVIVILAVSGLVLGLPKYNTPAQFRLDLAGDKARAYVVRVVGSATNDFPVAQSGDVTIDIPRLPRSCSWIWYGITIRDGSPKSLKAIHILREGRVIRRLSLHQVESLPQDAGGVRQISL